MCPFYYVFCTTLGPQLSGQQYPEKKFPIIFDLDYWDCGIAVLQGLFSKSADNQIF